MLVSIDCLVEVPGRNPVKQRQIAIENNWLVANCEDAWKEGISFQIILSDHDKVSAAAALFMRAANLARLICMQRAH